MAKSPKITPMNDGPLIVEGLELIELADGGTIDAPAKFGLCRCGQSAKKPFCDGSHAQAGFSSAPEKSPRRKSAISYKGDVEGTDVTVSFTPLLCAHAAECNARAREVFDTTKKPWVQPANGDLKGILDVVSACPSGALRVSVGDVPAQHLVSGEVSVRVQKHGPYQVKNANLDADFEAEGASPAKYVLCRCGLSKNKPFCDGTHRDAGWDDGAD